jgi:hypothetical protein
MFVSSLQAACFSPGTYNEFANIRKHHHSLLVAPTSKALKYKGLTAAQSSFPSFIYIVGWGYGFSSNLGSRRGEYLDLLRNPVPDGLRCAVEGKHFPLPGFARLELQFPLLKSLGPDNDMIWKAD